jgi:hypothetical protein
MKKFPKNSWFKSWGVGILVAGVVGALALLWLMRQETMPVPGQPDLPSSGLFPDQISTAQLKRTDTIEQERMICLLNATTKELMTVYLQTWNIVPPRSISDSSDRIWAFTEAPALDVLGWISAAFNYSVEKINESIELVPADKQSPNPLAKKDVDCPDVQVGAGKLGDRLWNGMRDSDLHFFAILPEKISNLEIESQTLGNLLQSHQINLVKQDNSYVFWVADTPQSH